MTSTLQQDHRMGNQPPEHGHHGVKGAQAGPRAFPARHNCTISAAAAHARRPDKVSGEGMRRALLMMPSLSTSGGMCVTVPVVLVSTRLTRSRLRARPKSEILAQKPCGLA